MDIGGVFIMKNLSTQKTNKLLIFFVLKIIVSSILSIMIYSFIFSKITYSLDLSLDYYQIFGVIISALSAMTISLISITGIKNNGLMMGIVSEIPLGFYILVNAIFNNHNIGLLFIKLILIFLIGALIGIIKTSKKKKFKVK